MTETHDLKGRPYAKLKELKKGDKVTVDDGFPCLKEGVIRLVHRRKDGELFIWCNGSAWERGTGKAVPTSHSLNAHCQDDEDTLMGIYKL